MPQSEISFSKNPEAALKQYQELGYHIEPHLFSDAECDELIISAQTLDNAVNETYRPSMMPHRVKPLYLEAMRKPQLTKIMSQLVSGPAAGLQTEFFFCRPGTPGFALHQDNFFVEAPIGAFASAWIALTDVTPENGGLIAYPGTHKLGQLPVRKLNLPPHASQDPNARNEESIVPEGYPPLHASVPKGAVFFIHGNLVHGSNANTSNRWRHVLLCTYIREGEKFREGQYAKREAIAL